MLDSLPRIVLVTRKTPLELLINTHGTLGQAKFYLQSRGQDIDQQQEIHQRFIDALGLVMQQIPPDVKRVRVDRDELDRFLFGRAFSGFQLHEGLLSTLSSNLPDRIET